MVIISKTEFQEMLSLGILNDKNKEWVVTCPNKPARRKKRRVDRHIYNKYLRMKNGDTVKVDKLEFENDFQGY